MTNKPGTDNTINEELLTRLFQLPDEKNENLANNDYFTQVVMTTIRKEIWLHNIVMAISFGFGAVFVFRLLLPRIDVLSPYFTSTLQTILSLDFYLNLPSNIIYIGVVLVCALSVFFLDDLIQD